MSAFAGVDTSTLLVQAMKVREQNHRFIANNIANVDTPHYNPVELDFQKTLRSMVEDWAALPSAQADPNTSTIKRIVWISNVLHFCRRMTTIK